jgi:NCS2 family nucleobase:cation symporter-2
MKKPDNVVYGLDDKPPATVVVITALQHICILAVSMSYPLIVLRSAGFSFNDVINVLQIGMIAPAVGTALQAWRGPLGGGYLAPAGYSGVYISASVVALKVGGLPLVWGMTIFAGFVEAAASAIWTRLRAFIPSEIAGLVVVFVGAVIGITAFQLMLGTDPAAEANAADWSLLLITLGITIALNIWGGKWLRIFCTVIGMVAGYFAATAAGVLTAGDLSRVTSLPFVAAPSVGHIALSFDATMIVPFLIAGLAAALNTTANLTNYQRLSDADWVRPDMRSISNGVRGDAVTGVLSGFCGTFGVSLMAASVGVVAATGVVSRRIAVAIAAICLLLAFQPVLMGMLAVMPRGVMAAILLFTASFIIVTGMQIITSRMLDGRRTIVIGTSMMWFIAVAVYPHAFSGAPAVLRAIFGSPLTTGTIIALGLNLLFRLGVGKTVTLTLDQEAPNYDKLQEFFSRHGAAWGARRDIMARVMYGLNQAVETLVDLGASRTPVTVTMRYDEFNVDVALGYEGAAIDLPDRRPSDREIMDSEEGHRRLAGFLLRRNADRVSSSADKGRAVINFHFDH